MAYRNPKKLKNAIGGRGEGAMELPVSAVDAKMHSASRVGG